MQNSKTTKIIILPGSCSSQANWFDQVNYFRDLGCEVSYLELDAYKHKTIVDCSRAMFERLKLELQNYDGEICVLSHSMGAMLLLLILTKPEFRQGEDQEFYERLAKSRLVFIQIPIACRVLVLNILDITKYLAVPFMFLHSLLLSWWLKPLLLKLKRFFYSFEDFPYKNATVNLVLNLLLMHESCMGTRLDEFFNLINYFREWREFDFRQESAHINSNNNYVFTVGIPDQFCSRTRVKEFAALTNVEVINLPWGFHSPQHLFWHQRVVSCHLPFSR